MEEGCFLSIYDPKVNKDQIAKDLGFNKASLDKDKSNINWSISKDIYDCTNNSDAILILTDWDEFSKIDLKRIFNNMRAPSWIFDTRNIINPSLAKAIGFNVWKIGNG